MEARFRLRIALVAVLVLVSNSYGGDARFDLPGMGGFAVSPDGATLVVSLTSKAELAYFDTVAGKEEKRVKVEFQPTYMAWGDKLLFAAQKGSGVVHILDAGTGQERAKGKCESPVRNLVVCNGVCFASTTNRQVFAMDAKGETKNTNAQGSFIAAPAKGDIAYTCVEGRATTDVYKYKVSGKDLTKLNESFRSLRASLINVQGLGVSTDGKQFGVVAGGGWADVDRKRHYSVPLYDTEDMKSQLGEMETGAYPMGMAAHPVLPLLIACNGDHGIVFDAKSYVAGQKLEAPSKGGTINVLAFVGKGQKLAWGNTAGEVGSLKFYDLTLTDQQKADLAKASVKK